MDLLVKSAALKPAISQSSALSRNAVANLHDGAPVEISADACRAWKLADRPVNEAPHKAELVKSFQQNGIGQIQPIVVRAVNDPRAPDIAYEVICGRVRWMAAKELGIPVQAIVREMDDREAYLVMSAENRQRKNISDYAKAKSYQKALALGVFATAQEFANAEGISKSGFSQYLGFADLPEAVAGRFADIAKIPYRLGYEINKACKALGEDAIIGLIPQIESGELSRSAIQQMQAEVVGSPAQAVPKEPARLTNASFIDIRSPGQARHEAPKQTASPAAPANSELPDFGAESAAPPKIETNAENAADLWGDVVSPVLPPSTASGENEVTGPLTASPISNGQNRTEPAEADRPQTESQLKKSFVSSTGRRLFTYNQASRGWLIRIAPDVSMRMDEGLMLDFGRLLEAYLDGVHKPK